MTAKIVHWEEKHQLYANGFCATAVDDMQCTFNELHKVTPDRRQSKAFILSTNEDQNPEKQRFRLLFVATEWRQMAIENTVSNDFDPRSSIVNSVFDCRLSGAKRLFLNECMYACDGALDFPVVLRKYRRHRNKYVKIIIIPKSRRLS